MESGRQGQWTKTTEKQNREREKRRRIAQGQVQGGLGGSAGADTGFRKGGSLGKVLKCAFSHISRATFFFPLDEI